MSFLRKILGRMRPPRVDPAHDPSMIKVFDSHGHEVFVTRQQWRDKVLPANLENQRDNPDQLYSTLVGALQDGFAADIVPYAEHLWRTDPIPSRGATILGIVYMHDNRLDDAERVLSGHLSAHGEDGVVLTNLAKVHQGRGDDARAESTLWHALEVEPNQDNGLSWYALIHRDRGGEAAMLEAYRRVAALPRSWRAQLWLARDALQSRNLAAAEALYAEALTRAERPVPLDLLMQMSGDLGNHGHPAEIVRLVEPWFDPTLHGLLVGNNLIKANIGLGRLDATRHILDQLRAQKRPDWQQALSYWESELASARPARVPSPSANRPTPS